MKSQNHDNKADVIFTTCIKVGIILGVIFTIIGAFASENVALLLGADMTTLSMSKTYLATIMIFAPFFIVNNTIIAFVRNDYYPNLSMVAMLIGSFSNIILDYIFMFPLNMGMFGAAFATSLAPIISIGVLCMHFIKRRNNFSYTHSKVSFSSIKNVFALGMSSFISELASAVVLIVFNLVILRLKGNIGVAVYGIVANIALVVIASFTGIAQGIQPLISKEYALGEKRALYKIMKLSIVSSLFIALIVYIGMFLNTTSIINIFNSKQSTEIVELATTGLRIYFIGFLFAGINIIVAAYLSAIENTRGAFIISIARGFVLIVPLVFLLSKVWNMLGVWLSFVLSEFLVALLAVFIYRLRKK